jgi:hypothetical protein
MRKVFTLFLLSCLTYYPCAAQIFYTQGYIVTTANDTIRGELREVDNQFVKFRAGANAPERDYNPSQLSAYATDGTTRIAGRISEQGKDTTLFMLEQIKGYTSLYRLIKPDGRLTHVLGLPNQTLLPLRGTLALNLLTTNLTECPAASFQQRLNPQLFYNSNLYYEQLVTRYNACVKPSASVKQKRKRVQLEAGLLVGAARNSWLYRPNIDALAVYWKPGGIYPALHTATIGCFVTIAPQKRLSSSIEVLFTTYKGSRVIDLMNPLYPIAKENRTYTFEEHYVAIPITARYVFKDGPIRWYAKVGLVPTMGTRVKGQFTSIPIPKYDIALRAGVGMGYLAGIGADLSITRRQHLYVDLRAMPHVVLYGVTKIAYSRSLQLSLSIPLLYRKP